MAEQKDRVVLAYSGGLDTSVCIKWLQDEKNLDVIALVGDVGQEHDGLEQVKQKALRTGAIECIVTFVANGSSVLARLEGNCPVRAEHGAIVPQNRAGAT